MQSKQSKQSNQSKAVEAETMNVLIIESPGKQKTIQGFLGAGWRVVASMGHIRGLTHDLKFLENNYEPTYEFLKEKSKAIAALKEAAKGAAEIYLAADRDFEGEQIAYSVKILLKLPASVKRITFTEITEKAIRHAIANPGSIDINRVHTQQARSLLDLLIGFTMSPLLWKNVAANLSAGRCQIPSIRLVVEREDAILAFKTESSYYIDADWNHNGFVFPGTMDDSLEDEESAINYMENVVNTSGTIVGNEVKPWSAAAPPPLMTSTLQQQASAIFGMNPKTTMMIAQRLYEAGHITYMRTDKAVISEEAILAIKAWVTGNYGAEFCINSIKKTKKVEEETKAGLSNQEAHEAIRPTHIEVTEVDGDGASLYRLIWQRTIQSQMAAAQGHTCTVKIDLDEFLWTSRWKRTTFPGWQIIGRVASIDEDDQGQEEKEDNNDWKKAIEIPVGAIVPWKTMKAADKETKAQGRYTEATLIRELEKHGIGRPSTFASLLATIQEKHYVSVSNIPATVKKVKEHLLEFGSLPIKSIMKDKKVAAEKNKLIPTELGRSVLGFMLNHFDDIFNYDFTSRMEQRLDLIAEGKEEWKAVVHDTWMSYKERYNALNVVSQRKNKEVEHIGEWNGQAIEKKTGKFGDYLQCGEISIPFLMEPLEETIQRFEVKTAVKSNERVFKEYVIRTGQYGPYIMKTGLKKPQFVSLSRDIDISILTDKDIDGLYKIGLEQKKSSVKKYKK